MPVPDTDWEKQLAELWGSLDERDPDDFVTRLDGLAAELPDESAVAAFERACARDSTGHPDLAVPLYERALELGLEGIRRRRATIQLASSLRNLGRASESVELLEVELGRDSDELDDAVAVFLALALADTGREREALSLTVRALAPHLPRYQRSAANYGRLLIEPDDTPSSG